MKKIYSTLLAFCAVGAGSVFGQITSYTAQGIPDSIASCYETIWFSATVGATDEAQADLTIDWGDGNTTTHSFSETSGQTYWFQFQHGYAIAGNYTATFNVYSSTSSSNVDAGQSVNLAANDPSNCGYIYLNTYQASPSMQYANAVYDFTGADGIITSISQSSNPNFWSGYGGLNTANAPYTVSINDNWLTNNGLTQISPDFTITSFNSSGMANPSQTSMEVDCAISAPDPDIAISYAYPGPFVAPWQSGNLWLNICNYACNNTSDATVTLNYPAVLTPDVTNIPGATVNNNSITFTIQGLSACAGFNIPFTFPGSVTAGTEFEFYLSVGATNDTDLSNNTDTIYATVLNSYDPNNKLVDKPTVINPELDETLQYVINFQNEGNFNALDVVVMDTISPNLDLSTFNVVGSKHGVATSVNPATRVVTFTFNDVNLLPASQDVEGSKGFVIYNIRETAGLSVGSEIENTAYIYFDFNAPIITNTTYNINQVLATTDLNEVSIVMYPNPASNSVRFSGVVVEEVEVYDMAGKLVLSSTEPLNNELSVSALTDGIYQVQIITQKGVNTQKLVVKK